MTKKDAYISKEVQLQNHSSTFIHKNESLLPGTSILARSPMVYNTNASLDKLTGPTVLVLANVKTYLYDLLGPKLILTSWM